MSEKILDRPKMKTRDDWTRSKAAKDRSRTLRQVRAMKGSKDQRKLSESI